MENLLGIGAWALAGLLGGAHCLGMCGGLSAALGLNASAVRRWPLLLAANVGRVSSYTLIGAALGGIGGLSAWLPLAAKIQVGLYLLSNLLIVLLGLYIADLSRFVVQLERLGGGIWRRLQPRFLGLLPLRSASAAFAAGALWGWLPCGLVYSAGMAAMASGSALLGAATLLAFGVGTLPNLLGMALAARHLDRWRQRRSVRLVAGLSLSAYGLLQLLHAALAVIR
ncbi:sulfite exporter TauE/SafE family protein [Chitinimonas sp.]|uniref:sulfite exporter TauE/SafE family protein n=1 Tax=Chitinimonas sp. TaxID=1934313 RepID=UPI0035AEE359